MALRPARACLALVLATLAGCGFPAPMAADVEGPRADAGQPDAPADDGTAPIDQRPLDAPPADGTDLEQDLGPPIDAPGPDQAPPPPRIVEDFSDPAATAGRFSFTTEGMQGEAVIDQSQDTLAITIPQGSDDAYAYLTSQFVFTLGGVQVRAPRILSTADSAYSECFLTVYRESDDMTFVLGTRGNLLHACRRELSYPELGCSGQETARTSVMYLPAEHLIWRLRATDADLMWETSPDGVTFKLLRIETIAGSLADLRVILGCGAFNSSEVPPGTAVFDDLIVDPG